MIRKITQSELEKMKERTPVIELFLKSSEERGNESRNNPKDKRMRAGSEEES